MLGRKNKQPEEQGRARQPRYAGERPAGPAFSYYSNRVVEPAPRQSAGRQPGEQPAGKGRPALPRLRLRGLQLPFWLLLAVVLVCAGKLLFLSADAKVIMVGGSGVSATYIQPLSIYSIAAQRALGASLTNHTKLTANFGGVARQLETEFPELQTVSVTAPLIGNRPLVYVQVAQPAVVLQDAHGNYALNHAGIVLAKLKTVPNGIPTLNDQSTDVPRLGKQFLASSTISFVQTLAYEFAHEHLAVATYVLPPGSPYELDVRPEGAGYVIKCNLQADPLEQSGAAVASVGHLGNATPATYLDVRTPGRVYYK